MKLVITDTSGEQVVIDTNGKTDGRQAAVRVQPDNGLGKQTEQKPQQSAQAATNDKKMRNSPGSVQRLRMAAHSKRSRSSRPPRDHLGLRRVPSRPRRSLSNRLRLPSTIKKPSSARSN
jgi:hypothetical protein